MDQHELVLTAQVFSRLVAAQEPVYAACGLSRRSEVWEWLVGSSAVGRWSHQTMLAVRADVAEQLGQRCRRRCSGFPSRRGW